MNANKQTPTSIETLLTNFFIKGKIGIPKKVINTAVYIALPVALLLQYLILNGTGYYHELGEYAQNLLLVVMFIKPVSVVMRQLGILRTILGYRRQVGIATFYFAFFHFLGYAATQSQQAVAVFINEIQRSFTDLWYGVVALLVMFVLYVTSNRFSQKQLGKSWKWIQRIGYILLPLVYTHSALVEGDSIGSAVLVTMLFIAAKIIEYSIRKSRKQKRTAA